MDEETTRYSSLGSFETLDSEGVIFVNFHKDVDLKSLLATKKVDLRNEMTSWKKYSIMDEYRETSHWILKDGKTTAERSEQITQAKLLSYQEVLDKLNLVDTCEESDELLLRLPTGWLQWGTSLWWACHAATNSPSEMTIKLVKLLINTISAQNKKIMIETALASHAYYYSKDVCGLLFVGYDKQNDNKNGDEYRDGGIVELYTASELMITRSDNAFNGAIVALDKICTDVPRAMTCLSEAVYYRGYSLLQHLTARRKMSLLTEILWRIPIRSRRKLLMQKDERSTLTPLNLTLITQDIIHEKAPHYMTHYMIDPVSNDLITILAYFCNEYCVAPGTGSLRIGFLTLRQSMTENHTFSTKEQTYHSNPVPEGELTVRSNMSTSQCGKMHSSLKYPRWVLQDQRVSQLIPNQLKLGGQVVCRSKLDQSSLELLDSVEFLLIIFNEEIDANSLERIQEIDLVNKISYWNNLTMKITFLVQFVVKSSPNETLNKQALLQKVKDVKAKIQLENVLLTFTHAHVDLSKVAISEIFEALVWLPVEQRLKQITHALQKNESVIDVSSITYPSASKLMSAPGYCKGVVNERPERRDKDHSVLITRVHYGGKIEMVCITIRIQTIEYDIQDSMYGRMANAFHRAKDDHDPKIAFVQFLVSEDPINPPDPEKLQKSGKIFYLIMTDYTWWYVYTKRDLRHDVVEWLNTQSTLIIQQRLSLLRQELAKHPTTIYYVSALYSTLGRRLLMPDLMSNNEKKLPRSCKHMKKCSALVICMTEQRQDWEKERKEMTSALNHLNAKITHLEDGNKQEILKQLETFSEEIKGDGYSIVAVMAHGSRSCDAIRCSDDSMLTVEEIVKNFGPGCTHPKIVILQYCRGSDGYKRSADPVEVEFVESNNKRTKYTSETDVNQVPTKNMIQRISLPPNFYVVYPTLPNAEAKRGLLAEQFSQVFSDITRQEQEPKVSYMDIIDIMTDVAGGIRDESKLYQHMASVDTLKEPLYLTLCREAEQEQL